MTKFSDLSIPEGALGRIMADLELAMAVCKKANNTLTDDERRAVLGKWDEAQAKCPMAK